MLNHGSLLVDAEVAVLRWPNEEPLRRQLVVLGLPRMLLLEPGTAPPAELDELEDWMRIPADPSDLRARARSLHARSRTVTRPSPVLDDDGLLWMGTRWVAITEPQVPVVRLLLEHLDRVVRTEAVVAAYEGAGGSGHPASVRTLVSRLGARVATLGLELVTVRRRGVLLSAGADPSTRHRQG